MVELRTLGTLDLRRDDGSEISEVLVQPKRAALLVYLAVVAPGGFVRRDILRALFWPDDDDARARASLRTALSGLRRDLDDGVVVNRGDEEVGLDRDRLSCDVAVFDAAIELGDLEQAAAAYRGPFLAGFHLDQAAEFDQWVGGERERLNRAYGKTVDQLARSAMEGDDKTGAVDWCQRLAVHDPYSTGVALRVMEAFELAGDRAGAIRHGERHAARLREDFDAEPSPDVEALAARMRQHPTTRAPGPTSDIARKEMDRVRAALADLYHVERQVGAGGMATVYLAEDLKHRRKVAVKVLRPELAAVLGGERFLKEIEVTANLQHPNILPLYDSGEADTLLYYVMPYVEGETLRGKLEREKQLTVKETVEIAKSVAGALSFAHLRGVIHRDIKPENILLQAGQALVADFGIALAVRQAGGMRLTETGLSFGTPHYMSPEQAGGDRELDARSDVYSLASVTYEMLTGDPPHVGSTSQAVIASLMTEEPRRVTQRRKTVPLHVEAAVHKALEKLPADRFTSAQDFAQALTDPGFRHGEVADGEAGMRDRVHGPLWRRALPWGITTTLAVTLLVVSARLLDRPAPDVLRFSVPVGRQANVYLGVARGTSGRPSRTSLTLSPDGDLLVYSAWDGDDSQLYVQGFDQERGEPIAGTEGAVVPFFSPDGAWIGFLDGGALKRVSLADGDIETIAPWGPWFRGATWGDDGTIVFAGGNPLQNIRLYRVAATGGEPEVLADNSWPGGRGFYAQPHMLPGSEALLFHGQRSWNPEQTEIVALDLATGTQKTVLTNAMDPRYVRTGHLLFMRQGTLMAVGFDPKRLEVQGEPVIMVEDVMHSVFMQNTGWELRAGQVAVSASGHLVFARGGVYPETPYTAVRVTTTGHTVPLDMDARDYNGFRVSPDGNRLAFITRHGQQHDISIHDLRTGVNQPLNTGGFSNWPMAWSPDGRSLAFSSDRDQAKPNVYRLALDGTGEPERLAPSDRTQLMASWSSQGVIAWLEPDDSDSYDIWVLPPDGSPAPFFTSDESESYATFSADGEWLAYRAPGGIYVRPYPGPEPAKLISDGGSSPAWSPDGRRIYYRQRNPSSGQNVLMSVDVTPGDEFQSGRPVPLIDPWSLGSGPVRLYDVFPDGSFVTRGEDDDGRTIVERFGATELHVVLNWFEELKTRVGN